LQKLQLSLWTPKQQAISRRCKLRLKKTIVLYAVVFLCYNDVRIMALLYPKKPAVFNRGQLYPGNIYARPAIGPYYQGLRGFGQARRTSTASFEDTLRSFATSPLAVNSQSYMDTIRERYGFNDAQAQNALGVIGGVVGAGVAVGLTSQAALSRRQAEAAVGFRPYTPLQLDNIKVYNLEAAKVAEKLEDLRKVLAEATTAEQNLKAAQEAYDKVKPLKNTVEAKVKAADVTPEVLVVISLILLPLLLVSSPNATMSVTLK
jgi:hypothetical protein